MDENKVILKISNLSKAFEDKKGNAVRAVDNVSFDVYDNEFLVLLGHGQCLSLINIRRCRRTYACRSRCSPYH